jgi:hypothetical protein
MRLTRTSSAPLAGILAAAALATPATAAGSHHPAPRQDLRMPDTRDAAEGRTTRNASKPVFQDLSAPDTRDAAAPRNTGSPVIQVTSSAGFDWGDAGIGAAGAAGLLAVSLAGAMTLRRRHGDPSAIG